jgi:3-dehydroquinate synthase
MIAERFEGKKFCIITDDNVGKIYLEKLRGALKENGAQCESFTFLHGEKHKTMQTVEDILSFLADKQFSRSDMLIALGGGIVGDVTGFAAAIYQRGIDFIQIPTTVLASVDSSVGGKTGVNLGGLKNQVGAFWQPSLVICDPDVFETLPKAEYAAGMAEVIKYAAICRASLGADIENGADIESVIEQCVSIKRDIVEQDERDTGKRQLLNLGHTFGHAIEKATDNRYTHGQAVAIGTVMAFYAAERIGLCRMGEGQRVKRLFELFDLPTRCPCAKDEMLSAMVSDKKRLGGKITLVLPRSLGDAVLYRTDISALDEILTAAIR